MFFFDPLALLVMVVTGAISGLTALWVKSAFAKYSKIPARNGMTGAQIADAILRYNDVHDVTIESVAGDLTDHYDPSSKTLRLSQANYQGRSIAALGVAAHEVGHAIQHAEGYAPLTFRTAMVPAVGFSSKFSMFVIMAAFLLMFFGAGPMAQTVGWIGVGLFGISALFALVTLPVEFDASNRALLALENGRILQDEELVGARRMLRAAASTYVAAVIAAVAWMLYYAYRLGLFGRSSN